MRRTTRLLAVLLAASLLAALAAAAPVAAAAEPPPASPEVIGGVATADGEFPWLAAVMFAGSGSFHSRQFCGGSLVFPNMVMTAGHCVTDVDGSVYAPSDLQILLNQNDLGDPLTGEVRTPDAISLHPRYDPSTLEDDIAIIRLSTPASVNFVAVGTEDDAGLSEDGDELVVAGWGSTVELPDDLSDYPEEQMKATVPVVGDAECSAIYDGHEEETDVFFVPGSQICAGDDTVDSCYGDSGGPLLHDDSDDTVVGIVSSGPLECADATYPGTYTETAAYTDFIEAHLANPLFSDVPFGHQFLTEIWYLSSQADPAVLGGFPDGTYKPLRGVTRQAMSAFMYRLAGEPPFADPPTATFTDVPTTSTFFTEIEWMADEGITNGFPGNLYKPGEDVSRQAMSAFMYRLADEPPFPDPPTPTFSDVAVGSTFFTEIEWMADEGITTGFPGGLYKPTQAVSRQAMAAFMYRLLPLL